MNKELICENCKSRINKINFWEHKHKAYAFKDGQKNQSRKRLRGF